MPSGVTSETSELYGLCRLCYGSALLTPKLHTSGSPGRRAPLQEFSFDPQDPSLVGEDMLQGIIGKRQPRDCRFTRSRQEVFDALVCSGGGERTATCLAVHWELCCQKAALDLKGRVTRWGPSIT